ncbi:ABC transporter substrate-binding protein [Infirmifilum sp.]|uniref:ABC transporter substrate-binding protein n=1 Tax=Infirmifilum sp. TaxID=2856575 RepID=UPI003D11D082
MNAKEVKGMKRTTLLIAVGVIIVVIVAAALLMMRPPASTPQSQQKVHELRIPAYWMGWHGNPFGSWDGLAEVRWYIYEPGAYVIVDSGEWIPAAFESWKVDGKVLEIRLRKGVLWHDEKPFTAKDVETFLILRQALYGWLLEVEKINIIDDYTMRLEANKPWTPAMVNEFLQEYQVAPYHIFGQYLDEARKIIDLRRQGKPYDDQLKALTEKISKPMTPIGTGPYKFVKETPDAIILEKFSKHYMADAFTFDRLVLTPRLTSQEVIWTAMSAGLTDFRQVPTPQAMLDAINASLRQLGGKLVLGISYDPAEYAFMFNFRKWPYNDVRFRKALAYIIDTKKIAELTFGKYVIPVEYQIGIMPSYLNLAFTESELAGFTKYSIDPAKAESLLKEIGFKRGADGKWVGPDGKTFVIRLRAYVPDKEKSMPAEALKSILEDFGFVVNYDPIPLGKIWEVYDSGDYDIMADVRTIIIMNYIADPINPYISIYGDLGWPAPPRWMGYGSWPVIEIDGKKYDTKQLITEYMQTNDPARKKEILKTLAYITNEWLPGIGYFQKKMMWLAVDGIRATGWISGYNPIYSAWIGGGEPKMIVLMIRKGIIKPVSG